MEPKLNTCNVRVHIGKIPLPDQHPGDDLQSFRQRNVTLAQMYIDNHRGLQDVRNRFKNQKVQVSTPTLTGTFVAQCSYEQALEILQGCSASFTVSEDELMDWE